MLWLSGGLVSGCEGVEHFLDELLGAGIAFIRGGFDAGDVLIFCGKEFLIFLSDGSICESGSSGICLGFGSSGIRLGVGSSGISLGFGDGGIGVIFGDGGIAGSLLSCEIESEEFLCVLSTGSENQGFD